VNVVLVGVQDKLPEGPAGAAIRAVFIDTFAAEWAARLQLLALSFSTLSASLMLKSISISALAKYSICVQLQGDGT
jgi:hypothetical protein